MLAPNENWMCPRKDKEGIEIYTEFTFEGENLRIMHRIVNRHITPVYFKEGDIAFEMPVYDAYDNSCICEKCLAYFDKHIENIILNGSDYPAHEVNFEQVILMAAATILLDKYRLCKQEKYLKEAEKHLRILRKLDGCQPDLGRRKRKNSFV